MTKLEHDVQTPAQSTDGTSISKENERKSLFRTRNQKTAVKFFPRPQNICPTDQTHDSLSVSD